jgi:hypothetical protein
MTSPDTVNCMKQVPFAIIHIPGEGKVKAKFSLGQATESPGVGVEV